MNHIILVLFSILFEISAMDYYSFTIDDNKVGYYETEMRGTTHYQNAIFSINDEKYENQFLLKIDNGIISEYSTDDVEWVKLSDFPENSYPTCAFTTLALRVNDGDSFEYNQISEGSGDIIGTAVISRSGNKITETVDGNPGRSMVFDADGGIIEFGWGGTAKSFRVLDRESALKDTQFAD